MSLLDTASLLLTPNAYKEGKLYSVIPSDGTGDFTFTRATTATRMNSNGLVELVPYNLVSYSEQFDNAAWTKSASGTGVIPVVTANYGTAPNGTLTADRAQINSNAAGLSQIAQTFTGPVNAIGTFSIWMKSLTTDVTVTMFIGSTTGNVIVTTEWQRFTFSNTSLATINDARIAKRDVWGSSGNADILIWGAQVNEGSTALPYQKTETRLNIPRLDYSNGTCPSILLEPQRTNVLQQSSSFDNVYWAKTNATIIANSTTAPDGTTTADTITPNITNGFHYARAFNLTTAVNSYTYSIYAKANGYNFIGIQLASNVNFTNYFEGVFNLSNGTIETTGRAVGFSGTRSITALGNGWYRCSISITNATSSSTALVSINPQSTNDPSITYSGDGTSGVYIWGVQLEVGSYATSYIPTTTASVTRNYDVPSLTNIYTSGKISASGGTWFCHLLNNVPRTRDSGGGVGLRLSNVAANNVFHISTPSGSNQRYWIRKIVGGVNTDLYNTLTDEIKVAIKWNGTTADVFVNGVKVVSGTAFTSVDLENLNVNNGNIPYYISSMLLAPTPLTDDQLAQLTTI